VLSAALLAACAPARLHESTAETAVRAPVSAVRPGSLEDFTVNVGDRVYFETDSSELTAQARGTLDRQVQWLNRYGLDGFTIEGHADERGTREYNLALGARRAQTVISYMRAKGIPAGRGRTISYGKERPVAGCEDLSCQPQNRRAVTVPAGRTVSAKPQ
jgi:peptidoglycan-associated lipoprotein